MSDHEIPTYCKECGGDVRMREPIESALSDGKVWRCRRGCTEHAVR